MTRPDLVPVLLDVTIDPCDGSVAPSLQYILIRGFTAMGWEQPKAASEDIAMAILEMIRPSSKPHPMDEGLRRTQAIMSAGSVQTIKWLRELAVKGGRGIVNNIDARCLGRIADEIERLTALNNKLTEDFNTLALDRSQWQECAKKAEAVTARLRERAAMLGPQPEQMLRFMNGVVPLLNGAIEALESQAKALSEAQTSVVVLKQLNDSTAVQVKTLVGQKTEWMDRALAAEARLAEFKTEATKVIDELVADLSAEIEGRYAGIKHYPSEARRYARDIATVVAARAFTNAAKEKTDAVD